MSSRAINGIPPFCEANSSDMARSRIGGDLCVPISHSVPCRRDECNREVILAGRRRRPLFGLSFWLTALDMNGGGTAIWRSVIEQTWRGDSGSLS